jgi:hypothetical protein
MILHVGCQAWRGDATWRYDSANTRIVEKISVI